MLGLGDIVSIDACPVKLQINTIRCFTVTGRRKNGRFPIPKIKKRKFDLQ